MSGASNRASGLADWAPSAPLPHLRRRAGLLARIRELFAERGVLEVETPVVGAGAALERGVRAPAVTADGLAAGTPRPAYLQSSPEFAMKRLLAAGSGPIYQVARAFRAGERGARHNPEFTLIEWYRPGWEIEALMGETAEVAALALGSRPVERRTYREAFAQALDLDPHRAPTGELTEAAQAAGHPPPAGLDRDGLLDWLLGVAVAPTLGSGRLTLVHDYPASQAALARVRDGDPPVAERFELFAEGVELANGYRELDDPVEQRRRFEHEANRRRAAGDDPPRPDERLLAALDAGLPPVSGVALGFDRLVMVAVGARTIDEVIAFPIERA